MKQSIAVQDNSVAILDFHDGLAGQTETWFEQVSGYHLACFVHQAAEPIQVDAEAENRKRVSQRTEFPTRDTFKRRPLIVSMSWLEELKELGINKVLPLTPDNRTRLRQIEACRQQGMELVSAIHPTVIIMAGATIAPGVWINAGSIIGYKAQIESGVLIDSGVQINHHNVLESCCQLNPGVITAGNVTLRRCCTVHTAAVIINRKQVGQDAIVGAGAVVIEDIPARCTAVGVPAKVIKYR